jgi:hypothetical protein
VGDLIHDKIGVFEKTQNTIIELDADVISILFHTERAENEVFHPMIIYFFDNGHQIFRFDNFTEFDPRRPQKREFVDTSNKNLEIR